MSERPVIDSTFDNPPLPEGAIETGKALRRQVSGNHYKDFKIQPIEYIQANGFDFITGNIIKYASRHKAKNGAEDVRKIIHYCELLLELEYGEAGGHTEPDPVLLRETARLIAEAEKKRLGD